MRDLGLMGESTFSLWCADVDLIPNGSQIDRTGWDFFVEFPFTTGLLPHEIHKSAFEFKVQVKATDKKDRKLQITLSNLRRLVTAQMPVFFMFIEFDGKDTAQRAFMVHVDNNIIFKVLKKIHEIEQSGKENNLNRRKMTIHYDQSHLLVEPNGRSLKACVLHHIGDNISEYIAKKKFYLESTGYENGFAQVTFTTEGEENLKSLIDVTLGIEQEVEVSKLKGVDARFGILSNKPLLSSGSGKLSMSNLDPTAKGKIRFKENRFSPGLVFECKYYNSPLNITVPDELKKIRIEGEFFDIKLTPRTGEASYLFSFDAGMRLEVKRFRDVIRLLKLLSSSEKRLIAELIFEGFPKFEFAIGCNEQEFKLSKELKSLDSAMKIISEFEITEFVDISFDEILRHGDQITQMEEMLNTVVFSNLEFEVDGDGYDYDASKETACLLLFTIPIGSYIFGVVIVLTGYVEEIDNGRFRLLTKNAVVEQKIVSEKDDFISNEDLVSIFETIEKRYEEDYSVITMFDKNS
tara:strand:- start:1903 stop:3462 length:1560 start_codon:yes stop_codon:yes gene_type:complete